MAAQGMQFSWRWNGGTISLNLGDIWEMSVNHVVEGGPHKTKEKLIAKSSPKAPMISTDISQITP